MDATKKNTHEGCKTIGHGKSKNGKVRRKCLTCGVTYYPFDPHESSTPGERNFARSLGELNYSKTDIAKILGRSRQTIGKWLKEKVEKCESGYTAEPYINIVEQGKPFTLSVDQLKEHDFMIIDMKGRCRHEIVTADKGCAERLR